MKRTLLVDGDIVVYKAGFAAEEVHSFGEDQWASTANLSQGKDKADEIISSLKEETKADDVFVCLSDDANWRKAIYPDYKAQRKKVRKPILLKPLREHLKEAYTVYQRPTLEADDVLGILATMPGKYVPIIASIDKDLLQIPGRHINIDSLKKTVVSEEEGDRRHLMQTLTGDVVDNYPGLPGCGPVTAQKLLDLTDWEENGIFNQHTAMWLRVVAAYEKKGLTEDDALIQARIARICRASDYDFSTKSVRLWTPPSP